MSSEFAIKVENISKCFQIYCKPHDRLKQSIYPRLQRIVGGEQRQYFREFWALKDVSFEIRRGETVGIVGCNGSGKSTLLQIICGTLNPTSGRVQARGRIAAMLELGSGFNPEFTGRENVFMNAAVMGLSQEETNARYADIVAFADIGDFMDQPVKTYSSGMAVRLAFAVQAQVSPDILIVDEALAVGDARFQAKCFERLKQLKDGGASILLVTHSSEQIVTHCTRAMLLDSGSVLEAGEPRQVVNRYMDLLFGKQRMASLSLPPSSTPLPVAQSGTATPLNCVDDVFATRNGYNPHEYRWGDGAAAILDFYLAADDQPYPSAVTTGAVITLCVSIKYHVELVCPILGITIKTKEGVTVYGVNSETLEADVLRSLGRQGSVATVNAVFRCSLAPGDYFISLGIATKRGEDIQPHDRRYDAIHLHVRPAKQFFGLVNLDLKLSAQEVA